ncbi:beta-mannosidase [Leptothrix discophora]|uniref:Beta-mannosidase B n=1 Tax=Leptothrix discophora TaxID=89 RepID=A0ABT9G8I4_LEPDI|nr:glycoside hydrolase family 2 protein [Leptothrix discophora]MDP4302715.1 glycoside hydrolase family 2 protein [Leptothrix discophora]
MTPSPSIDRLLHAGWQLREVDPALDDAALQASTEGWLPAQVPGTVYRDLIEAGRIPDPYLARHEADVQWVAERDWLWRLDFEVGADEARRRTTLRFDGLDTIAQVWLDGRLIARSDNMFVPVEVDVDLAPGPHRLALRCDSALRHGRMLQARLGTRPLWNGDSSRLYVRKAPYHYGWDWGPTLLTAGPWRPVRLRADDVRIESLHSPVWLADDLARARVDVELRLSGVLDGIEVEQVLVDADGHEVARQRAAASADHRCGLAIASPRLWWPAGQGAQPLYTLTTRLLQGEVELSRQQRRLGLRRIRLVQEPVAGEPGLSFHFEVNGRAFFCGGANWIPDDLLLERVTPARYRDRVQAAVDGGHAMLRVWGGGIYEDDAFYDACDELGVLVWQDFLFACGLYPAHDAYVASVEAEARAAISRLRHRASLAIWCGNNEDYTLAESVGAHGPGSDTVRFEARRIYEQLLPTLCAALDPQRPYWPGSPYTPGGDGLQNSQDKSAGDRHSWEVWHQLMLPYQRYAEVGARFVSEFGLQSHPSLDVLHAAIPDAAERRPGSRTLQWHNKASSVVGADGHRRLAVYLADNLPPVTTLAAEVQATQFVQAEAMRHAYEAFRRRWQRPGARACGGALVWQLNDCWPVSSWAIVDSAGQRKPAWHVIRRALAPLACAVRRDAAGASAWAMSSLDRRLDAKASWTLHTLDGETLDQHEQHVDLPGNASTELAVPARWLQDREAAVVATLDLHADDLQARAMAWPEPHRWHPVGDPQLAVETLPGGLLRLTAARPAKGVWLEATGTSFADNFIDLLAGESREIRVEGPLDGLRAVSLFDLQVAG